MKNMNNDELRKERKKEAIRKREAYINKKSDDSEIVEKKLKRKMQKLQKRQKMNSDELKNEREKEALGKKEIYWKAKSDECNAKIKKFKKKTINDKKIRNMNELVEIRSEDNLTKRKHSESAMTEEIITSTKKLKIDNNERYFNVYDDSNVIIMDKKIEIMRKRIQNRYENSLILISKLKIMGRITCRI